MLQFPRRRFMRPDDFTRSARSRRVAVAMCLAAVLSLICVQALHSHLGTSSFSDQSHCAVCVAAHAASMALCVALMLFALPAAPRSFQRSLLDFHHDSRLFESGLFSRPPPRR